MVDIFTPFKIYKGQKESECYLVDKMINVDLFIDLVNHTYSSDDSRLGLSHIKPFIDEDFWRIGQKVYSKMLTYNYMP